jgi:cytochrome c5
MSTTVNMWLGIAFVVLALLAVLLQSWLWSYPMVPPDDPRGRSLAPARWVNLHRALGVAYAVIYVVLMVQMVPRLWLYQVELPARTVVHAVMAITIGVLLLTKVAIIRFFRHFGKSLPSIGLGIFLCTIILTTLSVPFAIRAHTLERNLTDPAERKRIETVLASIPWKEDGVEVDVTKVAGIDSLLLGRRVLTEKCVACHDMRTILARPRAARGWWELVVRMAEKPSFGRPITVEEQVAVTAYLVALSPEIQESVSRKRSGEKRQDDNAEEAKRLGDLPVVFDMAEAKALYEKECSQCHKLAKVEAWGRHTADEWRQMVVQMIEENEAELRPEQVRVISAYLAATRGPTP